MTAAAGRPVLMSIRWQYTQKIFARLKTAEFRRRAPGPGVEIFVYQSGARPDRRGIVGTFWAADVVSGTAADHHREVAAPGIGLEDLEMYAGGPGELVWRIDVAAPFAFPRLVPLAAAGLARPPQSWQYLSPEQASAVLRAGGVSVIRWDGGVS